MRPLGDKVVAERLGTFRGIQVVAQADAHVVALRILAADHQAEAHRHGPLLHRLEAWQRGGGCQARGAGWFGP